MWLGSALKDYFMLSSYSSKDKSSYPQPSYIITITAFESFITYCIYQSSYLLSSYPIFSSLLLSSLLFSLTCRTAMMGCFTGVVAELGVPTCNTGFGSWMGIHITEQGRNPLRSSTFASQNSFLDTAGRYIYIDQLGIIVIAYKGREGIEIDLLTSYLF